MKNYCVILCLNFMLTGCLPSFPYQGSEVKIHKKDFKVLEGEYKNLAFDAPSYPIDSEEEEAYTAWKKLSGQFAFDTIRRHIPAKQTITIQMESHKRMHIFLKQNNKTILQKKLKGRWRSGAFVAKIEFILIPFFPVFYMYRHEKCRISRDTEGSLIVGNVFYAVGFLALFGADKKEAKASIHFRVRNE